MTLELSSLKIVADRHVSDFIRRGFFERWLTLPWQPFKKYNYSPTAYFVTIDEPYCIVSVQTFLKIEQNISK